jgi:hypothetical protein
VTAVFTIDLHPDADADCSILFPVWNAGDAAVDFTGATAALSARLQPDDPALVLSLSTSPTADGSIVLGPVTGGPTGTVPAGVVQVNISRARGLLLKGVLGVYALVLTWSTGQTTLFASGALTCPDLP